MSFSSGVIPGTAPPLAGLFVAVSVVWLDEAAYWYAVFTSAFEATQGCRMPCSTGLAACPGKYYRPAE